MPSNVNLIKQIGEIANAKGVDIPDTEGKNNAQLADILKGLKTPPVAPGAGDDATGDDDTTIADSGDTGDDKESEPEPEVKAPFTIAEGKSITTKRGILGPDEEIKAADLSGGQTAVNAFVKSGHIIKN